MMKPNQMLQKIYEVDKDVKNILNKMLTKKMKYHVIIYFEKKTVVP